MKCLTYNRNFYFLVILVFALGLVTPTVSRSDFIAAAGFDLLETRDGTLFNGESFEGVQLESFNFGGTAGVQSTGSTDTIIQRLAAADSGGMPGAAPPIPIELVALQLKSTGPVDLGAGLDFHFITLQSNRGAGDPPPGPPSPGNITITFVDMSAGTFVSTLDVFFDVRIGAIDGLIISSGMKTLTSTTGTAWDRQPQFRAVELTDVNVFLKGNGTRAQDFWPDLIIEDDGGGTVHQVTAARQPVVLEIPTLGALGIAGLTLALIAFGVWLLRRRIS